MAGPRRVFLSHTAELREFPQALRLHQAIPDPYSIGWAVVCLARITSGDSQRDRYWRAAREAWTGIGRDDLIDSVKAEVE